MSFELIRRIIHGVELYAILYLCKAPSINMGAILILHR